MGYDILFQSKGAKILQQWRFRKTAILEDLIKPGRNEILLREDGWPNQR